MTTYTEPDKIKTEIQIIKKTICCLENASKSHDLNIIDFIQSKLRLEKEKLDYYEKKNPEYFV